VSFTSNGTPIASCSGGNAVVVTGFWSLSSEVRCPVGLSDEGFGGVGGKPLSSSDR
jgi:hypothetical protein